MITLKNLSEATEQQVFDQVAKHLLTQNARSLRPQPGKVGACAYRGVDERKCAAGCLISDQEYSPSMEGASWWTLTIKHIVPSAHATLIKELQAIHDSCDVCSWSAALRDLARERRLNTAVIDNFYNTAVIDNF